MRNSELLRLGKQKTDLEDWQEKGKCLLETKKSKKSVVDSGEAVRDRQPNMNIYRYTHQHTCTLMGKTRE